MTWKAVGAAWGLALAAPAAVHASCIPQTEKQQAHRADVIFVGVAFEGPTETGVQRFEIERYLKGAGPALVRVATGVVARANGTGSVTSVSVVAAAGDRWRIYATGRADGRLETSVCAGSVKLGAAEPLPVEEGSVTAASIAAGVALLAAVVGAIAAVAAVAIRRWR